MKILQGNLPQPLYEAICKTNAKYSKGDADYSTTELIDSPRIRMLKQKHWDEIEEQASDMIWRFFGSVSHEIIANTESWNVLKEERMFTELDGITISGCPDLFDGDLIDDYKITSKYTVAHGVKFEWEAQENIYRYILVDNGWEPTKLRIVAICRDAGKDDDKIVMLSVDMWDLDKTEAYIRERIQLHEQAKSMIPLCTEEERWYSPRKFAVMKAGNKRALKLFNLKIEANFYEKQMQAKEGRAIYVEERPGENKRCQAYCIVSKFCLWWKEQQEKQRG